MMLMMHNTHNTIQYVITVAHVKNAKHEVNSGKSY